MLTPREEQILELVATGLQNKEIAARLGISEPHVRNRLIVIYDKLGVDNRTEAAVRFLTWRHESASIFSPGGVARSVRPDLRNHLVNTHGERDHDIDDVESYADRTTGRRLHAEERHRALHLAMLPLKRITTALSGLGHFWPRYFASTQTRTTRAGTGR